MLQDKVFGMISLGCDKNRVDGERLLGEVKKHGCRISDDLSAVNILIVNTCAFLNAARQESIETVLECNAYRNGCLEKIVVTGCLPQKFDKEVFSALTEADVLLGIDDAPILFDALEKSYREGRINATGENKLPNPKARVLTTPPHYAYLKIADGCNNHCTYCLIPKIRGKYRSTPIEELVDEAKSLGRVEELILVAQDVTRYGEDLYGEKKLVYLLKNLSKLDNICRIRLLYCYPELITDELIEEIRTNEKVLHYLDIPLQHSHDRVLKLMGRRGTRESYLQLFEKLKRAIPDIALRTTFIAGFPSETEEEHRANIEFVKKVQFTNCGFFAYSREEDTPAYRLAGQVHHATKTRRVKELYLAQAEISEARQKTLVGKTIPVLCDGVDYEKGCFVGRAYFQAPEIDGAVYFTADYAETGATYPITVERVDAYDIYGKKENEHESSQ